MTMFHSKIPALDFLFNFSLHEVTFFTSAAYKIFSSRKKLSPSGEHAKLLHSSMEWKCSTRLTTSRKNDELRFLFGFGVFHKRQQLSPRFFMLLLRRQNFFYASIFQLVFFFGHFSAQLSERNIFFSPHQSIILRTSTMENVKMGR
jgi:hypothetical protein